MAVRSKVGLVKDGLCLVSPKKSRQGDGKNTKYSATSRNSHRKPLSGTRTVIYESRSSIYFKIDT